MFVTAPKVVGDRYITSPSAQVSPCNDPVVLMFLTSPDDVTKPSWLFAIVSVTSPIVSAEFGSESARANPIFSLLPRAPVILTA